MKIRPSALKLVLALVLLCTIIPTISLATPPSEDHLSNSLGFKAVKTVTSTGKCIVNVVFPAKELFVKVGLDGVGLAVDSYKFFEQMHTAGWFNNATSGIGLAHGVADKFWANYSTQLKNWMGPIQHGERLLPGLGAALDCAAAGGGYI